MINMMLEKILIFKEDNISGDPDVFHLWIITNKSFFGHLHIPKMHIVMIGWIALFFPLEEEE